MTSLPLLLVAAYALAGDPETVTPIDKSAVATIPLKGYPDWLEIGFGSLWVSNAGVGAVQRLDLETNQVVAEVKVNRPCAAMAVGYDSVWVASRADKAVYRIDAKTNKVAAAVPVTIADTEASIAAGEGGIWVLTDKKGVLSRIDPQTNKVVAQVPVKPHSYAAMAGFGAIWVTNTGEPRSADNGSVQRVDPKTNAVVATIA